MESDDMNIAGATGAFLPDDKIVTWSQERDQLVRRNFMNLIKGVAYVNGGLTATTSWHEYEVHTFILAAAMEFYGIDQADVKHNLILRALIRVCKEQKTDLAAFRKALAAEIKQRHAAPEDEYHILMPLNIDHSFSAKPDYLDVVDLRLFFRSWTSPGHNIDIDGWRQSVRHDDANFFDAHNLRRNVPVIATVKGRNSAEALYKAVNRFELVRAALNAEYTWGRYIQFWGRPRPLGSLFAPPLYGVFNSDGTLKDSFFGFEPKLHEAATLNPDQILRAKRFLRRLRPSLDRSETKALLVDAARLYGEALETVDWRDSFLSLWRVLELITYRYPAQFNMKEVQKRAASLLHESQSVKDMLLIAGDARNLLVHRGQFSEEGQAAVMLLKSVVENCLEAIALLWRRFPMWSDMEQYYKYAALQPEQIESGIEVMQHIQQLRQF